MEKVNSAWGWDLLPSLCQLDASLSSPSSLTSGHSIRKQVEKELRKQSKAKKKKKAGTRGKREDQVHWLGCEGLGRQIGIHNSKCWTQSYVIPTVTVTHHLLSSGNTFSTLLSFPHAPLHSNPLEFLSILQSRPHYQVPKLLNMPVPCLGCCSPLLCIQNLPTISSLLRWSTASSDAPVSISHPVQIFSSSFIIVVLKKEYSL